MDFLILGPLEVRDGDRVVPLGGAKPRAILALLLLHRNEVVSRDRMIDGLWGDSPPSGASHALETYVSRLRRALQAKERSTRLLTRPPGYVLRVEDGELDLQRFEVLLGAGRRALAAGDARSAAEKLQEALGLFRGPPLDDLAHVMFTEPEVGRLEELRLTAIEERIEADLAMSRHGEIVGELQGLAARHPFREHFWRQLMLALYRSGRQADALAAFERARQHLADELGVDPGPELKRLHEGILRQDPFLDPVGPSPAAPSRLRSAAELPAPATATAIISPPSTAVDESLEHPSQDHSEGLQARPPARRWMRMGLAVALIVGLVAAIVSFVGRGGSPGQTAIEPGVALIDVESGAAVGHFSIEEPAEVIYSDGVFYVLNLTPLSFVAIDATTHRILNQFASPVDDVGYYAVAGSELWVTFYGGPKLIRMDARSGRVLDEFELSTTDATRTAQLIVGAGSVWVVRPDVGQLLRVDPATGEIQHRFTDPTPTWGVGFGDGAVWVTTAEGLTRIDPETNSVGPTAQIPGPLAYVAVGGGFAWTADETTGTVYKVDQNGRVVASYRTGEGAKSVSYSDGILWVANQDSGTVTGIDAVTGAPRTYRMGHPSWAVGAGAGLVAVTVGTGHSTDDAVNSLSGNVARFLVPPYFADPPDPAVADIRSNPWMAQVERATCAALLNYPDRAPPDGWRLQPEIAASMPTVSADGRTYTFTVRAGYSFSPPSNQPVTAEAIRYSIERALSPRLGTRAPGPEIIDDIEGETAFREGAASRISGLRADGDVVTITLTEPSPDFLERLALPFFCPVPLGTPIVPAGVTVAPPSAGPYYIALRANGDYTILKRNPNYAGDRPRFFDALVLREGIDAGAAVARVRDEGWDGASLADPLFAPGGALDRTWGPEGPDAASGQSYHAAPLASLNYLAFNASRPLFSDPHLRQGVALALDRAALARIRAGVAWDQLLPPAVRGPAQLDLHPVVGPDLPGARALAGGGRAAVMAIPVGCQDCMLVAQAVRAELGPIGIDVRIQEMADTSTAALAAAGVDMIERSTSMPYPDGASFLSAMLERDVPAEWLPGGVGAGLEELDSLTGTSRDNAAVRVARDLGADLLPVLPFSYGSVGEFLSARIGCRLYSSIGSGLNLAALCLSGPG